MLKLVKPSRVYEKRIVEMMDEWTAKEKSITPWSIARDDYRDFNGYLEGFRKEESEPPFGKVPALTYFCLDLERNLMVGAVNIRLYPDEETMLANGGSHIGDGIRPSERGKGYGTEMIGLALDICKQRGIDRVLMICEKDNIASAKSIMKNGGVLGEEFEYKGKIDQMYWLYSNSGGKTGRKLSEMTKKELWCVFPIFLESHKTYWKSWFIEEKAILENILPRDAVVRISHIGSTSIDGIHAKPIVDILVEIRLGKPMSQIKDLLVKNGYRFMSDEDNRLSLNKGYTEQGFADRVFHIHVSYQGDNDEIYFRNYLTSHPDIAKEYEELKLKLWKQYEFNRNEYTEAKTDFVRKYTMIAKQENPGKID
ncbi:MAG TPA: GNAT family N-acetyltransferase [Candidatus Izemoplasmatales bacterium]|nr:GNAT family N-acetyltransferase [Candidatus Izemoplasmatales bacterium]